MKGNKGTTITFNIDDQRLWVLNRLLERRAETHRDRPFLQYECGEVFTYSQVNDIANRVAQGLAAIGVTKGDKVIVLLPNCLEYMFAWFGVNKLGAVFVPVSIYFRGYFLEHVANNAKARVAVVDKELLENIRQSAQQLHHLQKIVVWERGGSGADPGSALGKFDLLPFSSLLDAPDVPPAVSVEPADLASIVYTSGTTGASKGVLTTHSGIHVRGETVANLLRLTADDVVLVLTPLFHAAAEWMVYGSLLMGAKCVVYERFSATKWIDQLRESGATVTLLMSSMTHFVFNQPERPDDAQNPLRERLWVVPLPDSFIDQFKRRLGIDVMVTQYGSTEVGIATMTPYGEYRPGTCGKLIENLYEHKIVDPETGEEVAVGQVGELLLRPKMAQTMNLGYNDMPDVTAELWRDGWFHTGDALREDSEGYFYFVDRIKDSIGRRGENISSFEVEMVINSHPAVAESAAIAIKSEYEAGESEVKACVVLKQGCTLTPEELLTWCEGRMPSFFVPRYVEFVASLPKTPNEKILKQELRARGITPPTWDREKAGFKLRAERERAVQRRSTAGG